MTVKKKLKHLCKSDFGQKAVLFIETSVWIRSGSN